MNDLKLKRKKGTTRELVSAVAVWKGIAELTDDEQERKTAVSRIAEVMNGGYLIPTGSGGSLRTGPDLARVVTVRTLERAFESAIVAVDGVVVSGLN